MKSYNKENYFIDSQGIFDLCYPPKRNPDYISYRTSLVDYERFLYENKLHKEELSYLEFKELNKDYLKVSSVYWYDEEYLYRQSDHWDSVADCNWQLRYYPEDDMICARIKFSDLIQNDYTLKESYNSYQVNPYVSFKTFKHYFYNRVDSVHNNDEDFQEDFDLIIDMEVKMYFKIYNLKPKAADIKYLTKKYKNK